MIDATPILIIKDDIWLFRHWSARILYFAAAGAGPMRAASPDAFDTLNILPAPREEPLGEEPMPRQGIV